MTAGPPNFSPPVVTSRACRRWKNWPFSTVRTTTYIVPLVSSITGVPKMPRGPSLGSGEEGYGGAVIPLAGFVKLTFHSGDAFGPKLLSASKAYTVALMVVTYTTL